MTAQCSAELLLAAADCLGALGTTYAAGLAKDLAACAAEAGASSEALDASLTALLA